MNREEYRKAFDELSFSADFQERTADLLRNRARELEKERTNMTFNRTKRIAVLAAACIALLADCLHNQIQHSKRIWKIWCKSAFITHPCRKSSLMTDFL